MTDQTQQSSKDFNLTSFFPYLVRIYYKAVSSSVSDLYGSLFGLSVSEWRTMAVLGPHGILSASEIVERSSMDKVNVSRAIKKLQKTGYLKRDVDGDDKRKAVLRLTEEGEKVYLALIPMVMELEQDLLDGLSEKEVEQLKSLMEKVRLNAEALGNISR
ncbi:MarR family winged helix-turn-helix transcriptional regulator [Sneathiella glossodoripedis]|uniref:MarR family winged helix-turn-helix transcriptional regulator n=1 Tax=Sneathiella glossodoripedis TaxID=418853 RepID=UPI00055EE02C|nr:MarR family transcriptional regulator [Sneathiella glossodoripedis]